MLPNDTTYSKYNLNGINSYEQVTCIFVRFIDIFNTYWT